MKGVHVESFYGDGRLSGAEFEFKLGGFCAVFFDVGEGDFISGCFVFHDVDDVGFFFDCVSVYFGDDVANVDVSFIGY